MHTRALLILLLIDGASLGVARADEGLRSEVVPGGDYSAIGLVLDPEAGEVAIDGESVVVRIKGKLGGERVALITHPDKKVLTDDRGRFDGRVKIESEEQRLEFRYVNIKGDVTSIEMTVRTPDFDKVREKGKRLSGSAASIELLEPRGRIVSGQNRVTCVWRSSSKVTRFAVAIYEADGRGDGKRLAAEEVPGGKQVVDFALTLPLGNYRWTITAYGERNQVVEEGSEEFSVWPRTFEPPEKTAFSAGFGLTVMSYRSTNSTFAASFDAGMTGPIVSASRMLSQRWGVEAIWRRFDFSVFQSSLRDESILGGIHHVFPELRVKRFNLKFHVGVKGGIGFSPEVLATSATQVGTGTITSALLSPSFRILHDQDEIGTFFLETQVLIPLTLASSRLGALTPTGLGVTAHLGGGLGLRLGSRWGLQGEFGFRMMTLSYRSSGDANTGGYMGYQGNVSVLYYY